MPDYLPKNDAVLKEWMTNFVTILQAQLATFGLVAGDLIALDEDKTEFDSGVTDHIQKRALARAATEYKNTARAEMVTTLRALVRRIDNHPGMTNQLRGALGLNPKSDGRVTNSIGPDVPDIFLESRAGAIIVHFGSNPTNEQRNSKPGWATGCAIYRQKTGESGFSHVAFQKSSPFIDEISGPAADYTYIVRYQGNKASELGAESSPQMIAAGGLLAA